jgi:hypothetical protein
MSKQVLSVGDFALILNMANERVERFERRDVPFNERWLSKQELKEQQEKLDKEREERINSSMYLQLKHLQQSLQNLNIEVETPDVELTHQHEDKGE